ncbi:hypothetical protein [Janibacter alittae]|uniref:Cysteine desulfurase n=1 Tax=Janibacter alittae TaxID=3115209 RepID=A0ABZ2MLN2_9MICO
MDARASVGRDAVPGDFDVPVADAISWGGPHLGVLVVRTGTRFSPTRPSQRPDRPDPARWPAVDIVSDPRDRLPHVCTFSVLYVEDETIVDTLARHGLAVASRSACTSDTLEPNHVLVAMGALTQGQREHHPPLEVISPSRWIRAQVSSAT